jgi:hypothetical protein
MEFEFDSDLVAPCCVGHLPALATCPPAFEWPNQDREDAKENVISALDCLAKLAPKGMYLCVAGVRGVTRWGISRMQHDGVYSAALSAWLAFE